MKLMKNEFLNVFATRARNFMAENYGLPIHMEDYERNRWHEHLGLLVDFSHCIVADVAELPPPVAAQAPSSQTARFIKLDAHNQPMAPDASDFFAVYDNRQKLHILARNLGGDACVSRDSGEPEKLIAEVNEAKELGFSDWRLADVEELFLIANRKRHNPAVDPIFSWIKSDWYHTSTPDASDPGYAWFVDFNGGRAYLGGRGGRGYVLAVRGGVPSPGQ